MQKRLQTLRYLWILPLILVAIIPFLNVAYIQELIVVALIWILLAEGLYVLVGLTGYLSLAQGAFFGIGAYGVGILSTQYAVNIWIAAALVIMATLVVSLLIGSVVFRTMGHYFAIMTLALSYVAERLMIHLPVTQGSQGIPNIPPLVATTTSTTNFYFLILGVVVLGIVGVWVLQQSRMGYALISIRDNEKLASSFGVSLFKYKLWAFVVTSLLATIGGILYSSYIGFISPTVFNTASSLQALLAVVIGGSYSIWGPVLGSFIVVFLPSMLESLQTLEFVIYGAAVVVIMQVFPSGICGLFQDGWIRWLRKPPLAQLRTVSKDGTETM